MMKQMCQLYKIPSKNTIKSTIDKKYVVENRLRNDLQKVLYFSLMTDIWMDTQQINNF